MSETPFEAGATAAPAGPSRPAWRRPQVGSRALLLLVVAAALLASTQVNRRRSRELVPRIEGLRPFARRLDVADPRQFAAVPRVPDFARDLAWDVHVPDGGGSRLCVATRGIGEQGMVTPARSAPIAPGRHRIRLIVGEDDQGTRFDVLDGDERRLAVEEPMRWGLYLGRPSAEDQDGLRSPVDRPLVLLRRRYAQPGTPTVEPDGPADGLLLWVERDGGAAAAPGAP